jgi:NAD(P)-dependent dehydrogenase (short-subunit alcohol dehydrogenase family)
MPRRDDSYERVAVVTGSDSRIGEAIAVALAQHGFDVGVTYRSDKAGAEATAEKVWATGRRVEVPHLYLSRLPEAADVVDQQADALGGLSVLVNCGAFLCAQRAARRMVASGHGGRIINVTSVQERAPRAGIAIQRRTDDASTEAAPAGNPAPTPRRRPPRLPFSASSANATAA